MRILHVNHFLDMGGSEGVMLALAREQKRLGHDVTICSMFGHGPLDARAAEYGIPVVHLHSPNRRMAKVRALHTYLGTQRYQVLHSHWGVWLATALAGFLRRIPRIHTNHSNQPRRWFLEHRVASFFTDRVVILTPYVEPYIARWVAVPKRKLTVIPNGIEMRRFETSTPVEIEGIPADARVIGMVARLSPPKDYATFLRAARIVTETRPDVHFVSVGNGQQREHYERLGVELGLATMHFLGGRPDVPALLKRMTMSVLCTRHEGHPLSLVEAMASGVPVIATDIPAVRFTLDEGRAGLLVASEDPEALAAAMCRLLDDARLREQLHSEGAAYAQRFTVEKMTQSYLDLYAQVIR
jgi:glycosyltransferase involved in cell wall biosynthesis